MPRPMDLPGGLGGLGGFGGQGQGWTPPPKAEDGGVIGPSRVQSDDAPALVPVAAPAAVGPQGSGRRTRVRRVRARDGVATVDVDAVGCSAVTKLHGAFKVQFLCAQRGPGVSLNLLSKFWRNSGISRPSSWYRAGRLGEAGRGHRGRAAPRGARRRAALARVGPVRRRARRVGVALPDERADPSPNFAAP